MTEADVGTFTIEAANDPNALNKAVHIRLPANYLTLNEIVSMWEKKIGKTLEKIYVPEEQVLKQIKGMLPLLNITNLFCAHVGFVKLKLRICWFCAESSFPNNYLLALYHSQQIRKDAVYEIDPARDIEASEAYPYVKYSTVDEYLNQFL